MKKSALLAVSIGFLFCSQLVSAQAPAKPVPAGKAKETSIPQASPEAAFTSRIISAEGSTFGYEILQNGQPLIRQFTIPGVAGNKGFATKADAQKVANLVMGKIKKGEMPPSVTEAELRKLKVLR